LERQDNREDRKRKSSAISGRRRWVKGQEIKGFVEPWVQKDRGVGAEKHSVNIEIKRGNGEILGKSNQKVNQKD